MLLHGFVNFVNCSNDGLLAFVENFVKDHFLPTMFVDYRKGVQQAISSKSFKLFWLFFSVSLILKALLGVSVIFSESQYF